MLQLFSEFRSIRMNKISEKVFLKINKQIKSLVSKYVSIKNSGVIKLYSFKYNSVGVFVIKKMKNSRKNIKKKCVLHISFLLHIKLPKLTAKIPGKTNLLVPK